MEEAASGIFGPNPLRATMYTILIGIVSVLVLIALGDARLLIPITLGYVAALSFVKPDFFFPGFTNVSTKTCFIILTMTAVLFSNLEASKTAQEPREKASTEAFPDDEKAPPEVASEPEITAETRAPPEPAPSPAPIKAVSTTVDELLETYAANQIAGERRFSNAQVSISGKAIRVRESFGTGILILASARAGKNLELSFAEVGERELANVGPGQRVTAVCYDIDEIGGSIFVDDCRSVSVVGP